MKKFIPTDYNYEKNNQIKSFVENWKDDTLKIDSSFNVFSFYDGRKHWLGQASPK